MHATRRPTGLLAIAPRALSLFDGVWAPPANRDLGSGVTAVYVRGPLAHYADAGTDSYEAIRDRVSAALETSTAVVLVIDSPGGVLSGCLDIARDLRVLFRASGKRVVAYAEHASSAAYALASACPEIWASSEALVGSIGVIDCVLDESVAAHNSGLRATIVTSGARKADGHPLQQMSREATIDATSKVDQLAAKFIGLVAAHRGLDPKAIASLEAAEVLAGEAQAMGLVDQIGTLTDLLQALRAPVQAAAQSAAEGKVSMQNAKIIEALREAAEGDDPVWAGAAKRALAVLLPAESQSAAQSEDEKEPPSEPPSDGEGEGEPEKKEKEEPMAKCGDKETAALSAAVKAELAALRAERKAFSDEQERAQLLATRPDLSAEARAGLAKASLDVVRYAVANLPAGSAQRGAVLSALQPQTAAASVPAAQTDQRKGLPPAELARLQARMGLTTIKPINIRRPGVTILGAFEPVAGSEESR